MKRKISKINIFRIVAIVSVVILFLESFGFVPQSPLTTGMAIILGSMSFAYLLSNSQNKEIINFIDTPRIHTERTFSAAHMVQTADSSSPCQRVHGHDFKAIIDICSDIQPDGMVIDFRKIKAIPDSLDHKMILPDIDSITYDSNDDTYTFDRRVFLASDVFMLRNVSVITSENLALYIKEKISELLPESAQIKVIIYEGSTSYAEA